MLASPARSLVGPVAPEPPFPLRPDVPGVPALLRRLRGEPTGRGPGGPRGLGGRFGDPRPCLLLFGVLLGLLLRRLGRVLRRPARLHGGAPFGLAVVGDHGERPVGPALLAVRRVAVGLTFLLG